VGAVLEYLDGRRVSLDLPFDVQATAFQRRVWQLLQSIPYGETRTYQQLAQEMGLGGNSSRAVGRACASNPVSLIVPCHRAVRKDGGLAGYRWGLERKEALLIMERGERRPENA
jgi:AraC family transcriptional regulator of adaptative response/methylated-DNA-[protein]-cysteine methyltransferase